MKTIKDLENTYIFYKNICLQYDSNYFNSHSYLPLVSSIPKNLLFYCKSEVLYSCYCTSL